MGGRMVAGTMKESVIEQDNGGRPEVEEWPGARSPRPSGDTVPGVMPRDLLVRWSVWLVLGLLWFRLIDHLRIEWALNPQYNYGFAVPFLCIFLLLRRSRSLVLPFRPPSSALRPPPSAFPSPVVPWSRSPVVPLSCSLFLYFPTRLIQEANPEWRLVSWALALEVIAITFFALDLFHWRTDAPTHRPTVPPIFPLLFFLVAVPWPTVIEAPLMRDLSRAGAATTTEVLNVFGIPALQHGNIIEVGSGTVGIDEACSGIRSFQATLMLSLLIGELYRLTALRRIGLCALGVLFAFGFNIARMTVLSAVAARNGVTAVAAWHDAAGVVILLGCFVCLWLLARALRRRMEDGAAVGPSSVVPGSPVVCGPVVSSAVLQTHRPTVVRAVLLLMYVLGTEAGVELWYRVHELHLPPPVTWTIELPTNETGFREVPISPKARQLLRYDEAKSATWLDGASRRWQATFLRWKPGRIGPTLASMHTPGTCIAATGRELVSESELRRLPLPTRTGRPGTSPAGGETARDVLQLAYRLYVFRGDDGPLHVFYCLWDDRALNRSFAASNFSYANRLAPVLAGSRNNGQRTLELAVWGMPDEAGAAGELERVVREVVRK